MSSIQSSHFITSSRHHPSVSVGHDAEQYSHHHSGPSSASAAVSQLGGGGDLCHTCGHRVYPVERVSLARKLVFHRSCFRCHECHKPLTLQSVHVHYEDFLKQLARYGTSVASDELQVDEINEEDCVNIYCPKHVPKYGGVKDETRDEVELLWEVAFQDALARLKRTDTLFSSLHDLNSLPFLSRAQKRRLQQKLGRYRHMCDSLSHLSDSDDPERSGVDSVSAASCDDLFLASSEGQGNKCDTFDISFFTPGPARESFITTGDNQPVQKVELYLKTDRKVTPRVEVVHLPSSDTSEDDDADPPYTPLYPGRCMAQPPLPYPHLPDTPEKDAPLDNGKLASLNVDDPSDSFLSSLPPPSPEILHNKGHDSRVTNPDSWDRLETVSPYDLETIIPPPPNFESPENAAPPPRSTMMKPFGTFNDTSYWQDDDEAISHSPDSTVHIHRLPPLTLIPMPDSPADQQYSSSYIAQRLGYTSLPIIVEGQETSDFSASPRSSEFEDRHVFHIYASEDEMIIEEKDPDSYRVEGEDLDYEDYAENLAGVHNVPFSESEVDELVTAVPVKLTQSPNSSQEEDEDQEVLLRLCDSWSTSRRKQNASILKRGYQTVPHSSTVTRLRQWRNILFKNHSSTSVTEESSTSLPFTANDSGFNTFDSSATTKEPADKHHETRQTSFQETSIDDDDVEVRGSPEMKEEFPLEVSPHSPSPLPDFQEYEQFSQTNETPQLSPAIETFTSPPISTSSGVNSQSREGLKTNSSLSPLQVSITSKSQTLPIGMNFTELPATNTNESFETQEVNKPLTSKTGKPHRRLEKSQTLPTETSSTKTRPPVSTSPLPKSPETIRKHYFSLLKLEPSPEQQRRIEQERQKRMEEWRRLREKAHLHRADDLAGHLITMDKSIDQVSGHIYSINSLLDQMTDFNAQFYRGLEAVSDDDREMALDSDEEAARTPLENREVQTEAVELQPSADIQQHLIEPPKAKLSMADRMRQAELQARSRMSLSNSSCLSSSQVSLQSSLEGNDNLYALPKPPRGVNPPKPTPRRSIELQNNFFLQSQHNRHHQQQLEVLLQPHLSDYSDSIVSEEAEVSEIASEDVSKEQENQESSENNAVNPQHDQEEDSSSHSTVKSDDSDYEPVGGVDYRQYITPRGPSATQRGHTRRKLTPPGNLESKGQQPDRSPNKTSPNIPQAPANKSAKKTIEEDAYSMTSDRTPHTSSDEEPPRTSKYPLRHPEAPMLPRRQLQPATPPQNSSRLAVKSHDSGYPRTPDCMIKADDGSSSTNSEASRRKGKPIPSDVPPPLPSRHPRSQRPPPPSQRPSPLFSASKLDPEIVSRSLASVSNEELEQQVRKFLDSDQQGHIQRLIALLAAHDRSRLEKLLDAFDEQLYQLLATKLNQVAKEVSSQRPAGGDPQIDISGLAGFQYRDSLALRNPPTARHSTSGRRLQSSKPRLDASMSGISDGLKSGSLPVATSATDMTTPLPTNTLPTAMPSNRFSSIGSPAVVLRHPRTGSGDNGTLASHQVLRTIFLSPELREEPPPPMEPTPKPTPPKFTKSSIVQPESMAKMDQLTVQVSVADPTTFTHTVRALSKHAANDVEKVRAIYRWITLFDMRHVDFDPQAPPKSLLGVLRDVKQGKVNNNELFHRMCRFAGVHCELISGYSKGAGYRPGMPLRDNRLFRNVWCAVYISTDGWRFVNCDWGARYLTSRTLRSGNNTLNSGQKRRTQRYNEAVSTMRSSQHARTSTWLHSVTGDALRMDCGQLCDTPESRNRCDEFYFLTDPTQHIFEHFPDNKPWQLLRKAVSMEHFLKMPYLKSPFFNAGLSFRRAYTDTLRTRNGTVKVKMNMPRFVSMSCTLENRMDSALLKGLSMVRVMDDLVVVTSSPAQPGKYYLNIYVQEQWQDEGADLMMGERELACSFQVVCSEHNYDRLVIGRYPPHCDLSYLGHTPHAKRHGVVLGDATTSSIPVPTSNTTGNRSNLRMSPYIVSHDKATVNIPFMVAPGTRLCHELRSYDRPGHDMVNCNSYGFCQSRDGKTQYWVRCPVDAFYLLQVYATSSAPSQLKPTSTADDNESTASHATMDLVYFLLIDCRKPQEGIAPFPRMSSLWTGCHLSQPLDQHLLLNRHYRFRLEAPQFDQVVVVTNRGTKWEELRFRKDGQWEGKVLVPNQLGELSVYGRYRWKTSVLKSQEGQPEEPPEDRPFEKLLDYVIVQTIH